MPVYMIEMALVFDIETVGENWDEIDGETQEALIKSQEKRARTKEEKEAAKEDAQNALGLSPFTGRIVAIGMLDSESGKGAVLYQTHDKKTVPTEDGDFRYLPLSEKEILTLFWNKAKTCVEFVTYNGRGFDVPFILVRSVALGVKPTADLMYNRYVSSQHGAKHYDLQDLLTFYSATGRSSLHLACRALGITSPKEDGISGGDVAKLWNEKKDLEIARYNAKDVVATKELFHKWREYIHF